MQLRVEMFMPLVSDGWMHEPGVGVSLCGVMTASVLTVLKAILGLRLSWSPLLVFLAPLDLQLGL